MTHIIKIASGESLSMNPLSSGFAHGLGVFETILFRAGKLFFWNAHWQRLLRSARYFNLDCTVGSDEVLAAIREVVANQSCDACAVKLSLMAGVEADQLFVYTRPCPMKPTNIKLGVEVRSRINEFSFIASQKTHNYAENIALWRKFQEQGFYECVRINTTGSVAEGTRSNIFFISEGRLHTPAVSTGALPGVTREALLIVAESCEIKSCEGDYTLDALKKAESIILTNSLNGLVRVDTFGEKSMRLPCDLYDKLMSAYQNLADVSAVKTDI